MSAIIGRLAAYDSGVNPSTRVRAVMLASIIALLAGCSSVSPSPSASVASPVVSPTPTPAPTATPTPTPQPPATFPLAVVTGLTNLKATVSLDEIGSLAGSGKLIVPCGVEITEPALQPMGACVPADKIEAAIKKAQSDVALLPPGLVTTATKVLSIAGDGPFGMFGADLFGDPEQRALPYPISGQAMTGDHAADPEALDPSWVAYDPNEVWTLTNLGSLCADRGAAYQAVGLGKGWDWAFDGGTAKYPRPAVVDPRNPPPYDGLAVVRPVDTGNDGATADVVKRSDLAIADHECPILPDAQWRPATGASVSLSVPEELIGQWKDKLGIDLLYIAANHLSDRGVAGIKSTLDLLQKHDLPAAGLGMNLDQALEPVYAEVAGVKVAVVAFNDVAGVTPAAENTPGVAWITESNIDTAVKRAKDGGADLVICAPQWWGGAEYHDELWPVQEKQITWFDAAGCDQVIGSGTHVAGPLLVRGTGEDANVVLVSPGNYMFGQDWWQEVQEGIILDLSFRGTQLVNVRMRPTVQILQARPALLDPEADGRYVLQRIWKYATIDY
jgi:poly-gamma-glutamate capsule biosynthesis protein CapA/YwtB (metallophosphatase superfamily)